MTIKNETSRENVIGEKLVFHPKDSKDYPAIEGIGLALALSREQRGLLKESDKGAKEPAPLSSIGIMKVAMAAIKEQTNPKEEIGESAMVGELSVEDRIAVAKTYSTSLVINGADEAEQIWGILLEGKVIAESKDTVNGKPHLNIPSSTFDPAIQSLEEYEKVSPIYAADVEIERHLTVVPDLPSETVTSTPPELAVA